MNHFPLVAALLAGFSVRAAVVASLLPLVSAARPAGGVAKTAHGRPAPGPLACAAAGAKGAVDRAADVCAPLLLLKSR